MKELKAIEIAKRLCIRIDWLYQSMNNEFVDEIHKLSNEFWQELQELMQEKSCEGCFYYDENDYMETCEICKRRGHADRYIPKG